MAVVVESSINALRKMLEERDDVPKDFPHEADKTEKVRFREYRTNWEHQTWQTEPDNGSLYPSEDSYTPYLEIV